MRNGLKKIISGIFGLIFLGSLASCSCGSDYLDGQICGKANDTTSTFYQIRKYYCEQYVYNFNATLVTDENGTYHALADVYGDKFIVEDGKLVSSDSGDAHYLFTYYGQEEFNNANVGENYTSAVNEYLDSLSTVDVTLYKSLLTKQAYGSADATSIETGNSKGYFCKVNSTSYDDETDDVTGCSTSVKSSLSSHSKAGLVFNEPVTDPTTGLTLPVTTWKDAWAVGLLYGLFVYPIGWLIDAFVVLFGSTGWAQIFAIFVVTFILKVLIFLCTFRSQSSTQKMQDIQPELLKLQAKYGQNPSPEEKQKMSMEMMALYKKYGVKPLAPFASLIITFPVFIAMYRAVIYLAVLRTGSVAGVTLGLNLNTYIIGGDFKWFAVVIFVLMAGSQILSMKVPTMLNRKRMTKEAKEQQKQANMMTNMMMIMILVMGFFMPVVMSIYWIASAMVAVIQQLLMHYVNNANKDKKGKFKPKKAEEAPITIPQGYKK